MADKGISQRISLEGADQIRREMASIAAAASGVVKTIQGFENASAGMNATGAAATGLAGRITLAKEQFAKAGQEFDLLGGKAITVGRNIGLLSVAAVGIVGAFGAFISKIGDTQEALQNTADTLGLTAQQFDELSKVSELSGVKSGGLEKGLLKLNAAMQSGNKPLETYQKGVRDLQREYSKGEISQDAFQKKMLALNQTFNDAESPFRKLGVAIRDENGELRNLRDVAFDVGDALKGMENGAEKTGLQVELFGTRNAKLGTFFGQSAEEIRKQEATIRRLAPTLDENLRGALDRAGDAFSLLGRAAVSTRDMVVAAFAPLTARLFEQLTEAVAKARGPLVEWANEIASKVAPQVGSFIALLQGRDQDVFPWMLRARDTVVAFGNACSDIATKIIIPAFNLVLGAAQVLADALNAVFGTQFTGGALLAAAIVLKLLGIFSLLSTAVSVIVSVVSGLVLLFGGGLPAAIAVLVVAIAGLLAAWVQSSGGIQAIWDKVTTAIRDAWAATIGAITGGISSALSAFQNFYNSVIGWFGAMIDKARAFAQAQSAAAAKSGEGGGQAFARGGPVRGPGTGTSDSIAARLSNGEYVIRAAAVRRLGIGLLNRLNGSADTFADVLRGVAGRGVPGFAAGGLVTTGGDSGGSMRPFVLQLEGQSFGGMRASEDTIARLVKYSTAKSVRSAGRKPSWVGGR